MENLQTANLQTENPKMTPDIGNDLQLVIERTFDAPRDLVFQAWTDKEHMVKWWGPAGFTIPLCEIDFREGGRYRACMREPDGTDHIITGVYQEINAPEKLVFTWAWEEDGVPGHEMLVSVDFAADGDKTHLTLTHTGFENEESREGHNQGWCSSFECLTEILA